MLNVAKKAGERVIFQDEGHIFNDAKLSHTQPWRSRYPTPRDLKERLARGSGSDDGV